ncbi:TraB/VirB10 family protein [Hippea maritima]|uniref:Pilus assembly protein n=1 Tax=Hippea maritima (strain ATCC 700847 / DSM 10411 / MH2) TaxID=760142 RepID=F2LV25_HIPMA|nr:TraB/VirB10 family protein [Hippea maritima]AEA33609.1 pilus assembly protein [Hippea maritima DSM 10411]
MSDKNNAKKTPENKKEKTTNLIKSIWDKLDPKTKHQLSIMLSALIIIILAITGYYLSHNSNNEQQRQVESIEKPVKITLQPGILEKNINNNVNHKLTEFEKRLQKLQQQVAKRQQTNKQQTNKLSLNKQGNSPNKPTNTPPFKSPQLARNFAGGLASQNGNINKRNMQPEPQIIGGIGIAENQNAAKSSIDKSLKKKKPTEGVYLPPSFMEASLLSGLDAPTMNGAKSNPVPVLLRVRAPAILPNRVRANLKGCFIIAEGFGNLASERVMLRLVSLSCIAKSGQAVIDQPVKGFVVGSDGKIGLRGRVVSKMGSVLARAALAGFLTGFGNAVQTSAASTYTSTLGTSSTVKSSDVARSALGGGISQATKKLADFYMKLAGQTLPVIEVGATRRVTVVISKGVMLNIKNVCVGGKKCKDQD